MTETLSTVIVKSYLLQQDPASCYHLKLSFLRQLLSAVNYCHKELHLRYGRRSGSTSDYSIWQSNYSFGASNYHLVQFNCIFYFIGAAAYMVILKSYFTRGPRNQVTCQRLSKIELPAIKVNCFYCKAIATKSSILDTAGVSHSSLITIFGKITFNLTQATVTLFNLIAIYGGSFLPYQ